MIDSISDEKAVQVKTKTVLCLGASIMHGRVSSSFINVLRKKLDMEGFKFINKAVPGYEAYNVLTHLDEYITCTPDYVIILVGTNDVTADIDPKIAKMSRKTKKIPFPPSPQFYSENMLKIIKILKEKTSAKIALASLPVLGEDLDSLPNRKIREYNSLLKNIVSQEQIDYLPVYERQEEFLQSVQKKPGRPYMGGIKLSIMLLIRHFLLRQSFDTISKKNGFLLVTDGIHLNSLGASFITEEVERFLRTSI